MEQPNNNNFEIYKNATESIKAKGYSTKIYISEYIIYPKEQSIKTCQKMSTFFVVDGRCHLGPMFWSVHFQSQDRCIPTLQSNDSRKEEVDSKTLKSFIHSTIDKLEAISFLTRKNISS